MLVHYYCIYRHSGNAFEFCLFVLFSMLDYSQQWSTCSINLGYGAETNKVTHVKPAVKQALSKLLLFQLFHKHFRISASGEQAQQVLHTAA